MGIGMMMIFHGWPKLAGGIHLWEKSRWQPAQRDNLPGFWASPGSLVGRRERLLIVIDFVFVRRPS
jgi:hypothetical protein